jgi:phage shock protein E
MNHTNLSPAQFDEQIGKNENAVIIDVRMPNEKVEGDIEGSTVINIMSPDFADKIKALDRTKDYYVFCRSGGRSSTACGFMTSNGFESVYNLEGGINAWNQYEQTKK